MQACAWFHRLCACSARSSSTAVTMPLTSAGTRLTPSFHHWQVQSAPKRVLANSLSWDERLTLCAHRLQCTVTAGRLKRTLFHVESVQASMSSRLQECHKRVYDVAVLRVRLLNCARCSLVVRAECP